MKERILALLIAKFSGVRKDGLTALARSLALQCATEDEANGKSSVSCPLKPSDSAPLKHSTMPP